jgi:hypothetical protein
MKQPRDNPAGELLECLCPGELFSHYFAQSWCKWKHATLTVFGFARLQPQPSRFEINVMPVTRKQLVMNTRILFAHVLTTLSGCVPPGYMGPYPPSGNCRRRSSLAAALQTHWHSATAVRPLPAGLDKIGSEDATETFRSAAVSHGDINRALAYNKTDHRPCYFFQAEVFSQVNDHSILRQTRRL